MYIRLKEKRKLKAKYEIIGIYNTSHDFRIELFFAMSALIYFY